MLRPSKHALPDQTVVAVAAILLKHLRKWRLVDYESLSSVASKKVRGGDVLFLPAVHTLFVLGLIEYRTKTDSFEYVGA